MTKRDVALLAFKLLGLWLIVNALIGLGGIPYYWEPHFESIRTMTVISAILPALIAIGIGAPLWFSAEWFAERLCHTDGSEPTPTHALHAQPVLALAITVLGVFFVCDALPTLVNGLALFSLSRTSGSTLLGPDTERQTLLWSAAAKAAFAAGIARFVIGAGLIVGPARLATVLARVRKELGGSLVEGAAANHHE